MNNLRIAVNIFSTSLCTIENATITFIRQNSTQIRCEWKVYESNVLNVAKTFWFGQFSWNKKNLANQNSLLEQNTSYIVLSILC